MYEMELKDGRKVLIVTPGDLFSLTIEHLDQIRRLFNVAGERFQVIVILVNPELGLNALPKWMRGLSLRPSKGMDQKCWIMEFDPETGEWIKPEEL